jgi:hypothetical protein
MGDEKGAVTTDLILWVAGTLIAIFVFVGIVWPWLLSIWYGACWADARTDLRGLGQEIETGIRAPVQKGITYELNMGDCVAGVVFVNGREDPVYSKFIEEECSEYSGYKSYMVAIPKEAILAMKNPEFVKEYEEMYKEKFENLKDSLDFWDAVKLWVKEKTGRVPPSYCYEFEHSFSGSGKDSIPSDFWEGLLEAENWNKGTGPYCLQIDPVPTADSFDYRITPYVCPVKTEEKKE